MCVLLTSNAYAADIKCVCCWQVVIPCPVEFEIAELRKQEPQESKFRYLNDQFVCCSCHSDSDSEEEYQLDEDGQVHVVQTPNKVWSDESVPIQFLYLICAVGVAPKRRLGCGCRRV